MLAGDKFSKDLIGLLERLLLRRNCFLLVFWVADCFFDAGSAEAPQEEEDCRCLPRQSCKFQLIIPDAFSSENIVNGRHSGQFPIAFLKFRLSLT
jgi:hypothetical protein